MVRQRAREPPGRPRHGLPRQGGRPAPLRDCRRAEGLSSIRPARPRALPNAS